MPFPCDICRNNYVSRASLSQHKSRYHKGGKQTGKGPIDHLRLYSTGKTPKEILDDHLDNNKDMYDDEEWKSLKRKAQGEDEEPIKFPKFNDWPCKLCSERFDTEREHDLHMAEKHPTCLDCRKQFPNQKEYDEHTHPECRVCKKTFPTDQRLNNHLKSHPKCYRCDKLFLNEAKLRLHVMKEHGRRRPPVKQPARSRSRSPFASRASSEDNESLSYPESEISDNNTDSVFSPSEPRAESEISLSDESESLDDLDEGEPDPDEGEPDPAEGDPDEEDLEPENLEDSLEDSDRASRTREISPDDRSSVRTVESIPSTQLKKCPKCYLKFTSQAVLNMHMKTHARKRSRKPKPRHYVCHYCGKHLPSQESLDEHVEAKHPKRKHVPKREHAPTVYQCGICKDILKTKEGYEQHLKNHRRYDCRMCAARFDSATDRDMHMSLNHPRCTLCDMPFATHEEYVRHRHREHPEPKVPLEIPSETEDELGTDEEDIDVETRQFHKHINCVTIERFLEIRELINQNAFDSLFNDDELLEGLQIIFKGVIKGYIPICTAQRVVLSQPMRKLLYRFAANPSGALLNRNKKNLKQLFQILWESVNTVINSFMKYV